jgi:hypothetical protein
MDPSRLTQGQKIAGGAGVLLLVSLFLSWYGVDLGGIAAAAGVDVSVNAWDAFGLIDLVLFLTALAAIAHAALAASDRKVELPVSPAQVVAGLGALSVLLIVYRLLNQPGPNELVGVRFGLFVGLLGAIGVALGGFRSLQDEPAVVTAGAGPAPTPASPAAPPTPAAPAAPAPPAPAASEPPAAPTTPAYSTPPAADPEPVAPAAPEPPTTPAYSTPPADGPDDNEPRSV